MEKMLEKNLTDLTLVVFKSISNGRKDLGAITLASPKKPEGNNFANNNRDRSRSRDHPEDHRAKGRNRPRSRERDHRRDRLSPDYHMRESWSYSYTMSPK